MAIIGDVPGSAFSGRHHRLVFRPGMEDPEAIVYTPHGVYPETGKLWERTNPKMRVTAWSQGLHEDRFG